MIDDAWAIMVVGKRPGANATVSVGRDDLAPFVGVWALDCKSVQWGMVHEAKRYNLHLTAMENCGF